ncbi:MAG TPA: alpha-L-fucosidase [Bacteroidales bacterium]|nr:alpha-L-fucosidase [Bacteroidales bacterium]
MKKTRTIFLSAITAAMFAMLLLSCKPKQEADNFSSDPSKHRLPKSDRHYQYTSGYIEDIPVPGYRWASRKAYEEFNDMKFGVRIHWGLYSITQQPKESWPYLTLSNEDKQAYNQMYKTWNPQGFNADEWMNLFADAGMKMFAFTSKHHEGFSMFDTKTRVKRRVNYTAPGGPVIEDCDLAYSIMETPFKRDVVKELTDAAHKKGIKIDLYFSHPDWYDADFRPYVWHPLQVPSSDSLTARGPDLKPQDRTHWGDAGPVMVPDASPEEIDRMMKRHRDQLVELLTNYGKIDMLCLDMWFGPTMWPKLRETILELRKIQPDVMLRDRGIGNYGDYYTPEGFIPGEKDNSEVPWFVIYPLGRFFSYEKDSAEHKGAKWIVENILDCAAKGGNFMVGIGPDGNGRFHPEAERQLRQTGRWLKINGEGVYATRARNASVWKEGDNIRFTRSKDEKTIYAHCFNWPEDSLILKTVKPEKGSNIYLIGNDSPLKWQLNDNGDLVIETPESLLNSIPEELRLAYSFRISVQK